MERDARGYITFCYRIGRLQAFHFPLPGGAKQFAMHPLWWDALAVFMVGTHLLIH